MEWILFSVFCVIALLGTSAWMYWCELKQNQATNCNHRWRTVEEYQIEHDGGFGISATTFVYIQRCQGCGKIHILKEKIK